MATGDALEMYTDFKNDQNKKKKEIVCSFHVLSTKSFLWKEVSTEKEQPACYLNSQRSFTSYNKTTKGWCTNIYLQIKQMNLVKIWSFKNVTDRNSKWLVNIR